MFGNKREEDNDTKQELKTKTTTRYNYAMEELAQFCRSQVQTWRASSTPACWIVLIPGLFSQIRNGSSDRFGVIMYNLDSAKYKNGVHVFLELDQPDVNFIKTLEQQSSMFAFFPPLAVISAELGAHLLMLANDDTEPFQGSETGGWQPAPATKLHVEDCGLACGRFLPLRRVWFPEAACSWAGTMSFLALGLNKCKYTLTNDSVKETSKVVYILTWEDNPMELNEPGQLKVRAIHRIQSQFQWIDLVLRLDTFIPISTYPF